VDFVKEQIQEYSNLFRKCDCGSSDVSFWARFAGLGHYSSKEERLMYQAQESVNCYAITCNFCGFSVKVPNDVIYTLSCWYGKYIDNILLGRFQPSEGWQRVLDKDELKTDKKKGTYINEIREKYDRGEMLTFEEFIELAKRKMFVRPYKNYLERFRVVKSDTNKKPDEPCTQN